jgi:hypothetical protein
MKNENKKERLETLDYNEAILRNGDNSPQKVRCEFGSLPPA